MEPTTLALIAVAQVIILALIQGIITARAATQMARIRRDEKAEDYARQDLVAARTVEVAKVAAAVADRITGQLQAIDEQGKQIHILVNSDMTAARTNERDQAKLTLVALKRVQALSAKLGLPTDLNEEEAIETAEKRIEELDRILADRLAAQKKVDEERKKS